MPTEFKNVSEITQRVREIIRDNSDLENVWIQGEIADVKRPRNGNTYFILKDNSMEIECVIFKDRAPLQNNLSAVRSRMFVKGQIDVYKKKSEYRFVVTGINLPEDAPQSQSVSVTDLTNTLESTIADHSGEVQGEISAVFVTSKDYTILKLKDVTTEGQPVDIIECVLPPEISPSFSLQKGESVCVRGKFGIFAKASAYRIEIGNADNITPVKGKPKGKKPAPKKCKDCHQYFSELQDRSCHICYNASLTSEGIVVGAVMRYFERFKDFTAQREYPIDFTPYIKGRADIALLNSKGNPVAIAECKRIEDNNRDDGINNQLKPYLNVSKTNLGLFADDTDPCEWIFLKKNSVREEFDKISRSQFERELGVEPTSEIPPGRTRLELILGNIIESEVDAIVNAANSQFTKGSGVDGAIREAGGRELDRELQEIFDREGICPPGKAVITKGGNLHARHVIHAVGPIYQGGEFSELKQLALSYKNSLKVAVENGINSIAFPAISTGNFGFPIEQATPIALNTVKEFVEQAHQNNEMVPEHIQFVLFDEEAYNCYVKELANLGLGISCLIG